MDGPTILQAVRDAYSRCQSYQDSGDVVSVFVQESPRPNRRTTSRPFSTWFVRPNRFRFEFAERTIGPPEEWRRHVVWERDGVARSWWSIKGERESKDLPMLIAGATGISGGSANRVPRMLMPDRFKPGEVPTATLLGAESVDGISCHKVGLSWQREGHTFAETWWVGVDDLLLRKEFNVHKLGGEESKKLHERGMEHLRKAYAEGKLGGRSPDDILRHMPETQPFTCESTTTYSPMVNGPIPDPQFEFTPPA